MYDPSPMRERLIRRRTMTNEREYIIGRPRNERELDDFLELASMVYHVPKDNEVRYADLVGRRNLRVCKCDDQVVAGLALVSCGQFFGGRSVPMTGVAMVATSPEHRGLGAASAMLNSVMHELHAAGVPISSLYPATVPLYRRAGYELAGSRSEIRLRLREMNLSDHEMELRRITPGDRPELETLHRARGVRMPGNIDRSDFFWKRIEAPRGERAMGYAAVNEQGRIEGHVYFLFKPSAASHYMLQLSDFIGSTPRAARRLLSFLQDHRSLADEAVFFGDGNDSLLLLMPERTYQVKLCDHWMLRIVDVGAALTARGWPAHGGPGVEVHLDVEDNVLNDNNGRYILEVDGAGAANVSTGGNGDLKIDIRGLASLYAGFASPRDLLAAGHLTIPPHVKHPESALNRATMLFAGPMPTMSDGF
jgi:predicted acetyltransferase